MCLQGGVGILNVKFVQMSAGGTAGANAEILHVLDPEFSAHAGVTLTIVTSHRVVAAAQPSYLKSCVHLLRANADVAPWMAALLSGCWEGSCVGGGWGGLWSRWAVSAGAVAAALTMAVG
jgi:hypothetical protein